MEWITFFVKWRAHTVVMISETTGGIQFTQLFACFALFNVVTFYDCGLVRKKYPLYSNAPYFQCEWTVFSRIKKNNPQKMERFFKDT